MHEYFYINLTEHILVAYSSLAQMPHDYPDHSVVNEQDRTIEDVDASNAAGVLVGSASESNGVEDEFIKSPDDGGRMNCCLADGSRAYLKRSGKFGIQPIIAVTTGGVFKSMAAEGSRAYSDLSAWYTREEPGCPTGIIFCNDFPVGGYSVKFSTSYS